MKICILDPSYENSNSPMKEYDPPSDVVRHLDPEHVTETFFINKATAVRQIIELSRRDFDVFINLCDGAWDEDRPGIEVVQTLEKLGLPFTGAAANSYEPTREMMKRVCHFWGVKTPACVFATDRRGVELAARSLRFPLIVKHPNSYSSIGLTRTSRVETSRDLHAQARKMIDAFAGALIEEFIEGREFTVLVVENADNEFDPLAYAPIEFRFPPGESFKHFDLKWIDWENMSCALVDGDLAERLKDMSKKLFLGLNGTGYGRCDIRMDHDGELYMLEINPNCDVSYPLDEAGSADLILMNEEFGHRDFFERIIKAALKRQQRRVRKWQLLLDGESQYGMYAVQTIKAGEIIERYEERPHVLVSRTHVNRNWTTEQQRWFMQYAYPLTDEIYVSWSHEPEHWKPINHSCDPSAWLDGLNLVARRRIAAGAEITMDYATFCNESMEEFVCRCGARQCRGVIRGTDYREPFMERYGDHVSDFVRMKRDALQEDLVLT
jgi:D-alanine-D-alanine ligase-like ATP-grasp enzyme